MQNIENDLFLNAFEPLATNGTQKATKRRSSILKTIEINYGNEERRTSRRVSWAKTFQYKELLADGTAVVMFPEFSGHKSEEVIPLEPSVPQIEDKSDVQTEDSNENIIKAKDFINRLKANTSVNNSFTENQLKRHQNTDALNESVNHCPKPKKSKKTSKGLTKYLNNHYDNDNEKDCLTVFNTSFNKYGRQLVPRTPGLDFTQLFNEENNEMNLTSVSQSFQLLAEECVDMSLTSVSQLPQLFTEENSDMNVTSVSHSHQLFTEESSDMSLTSVTQSRQQLAEVSVEMDVTSVSQSHQPLAEENRDMSLTSVTQSRQPLAEESVDMSLTTVSQLPQPLTEESVDMSLTSVTQSHQPLTEECVDMNVTSVSQSGQPLAEESVDMSLTSVTQSHHPLTEESVDMNVTTVSQSGQHFVEESVDMNVTSVSQLRQSLTEESVDMSLTSVTQSHQPLTEESVDMNVTTVSQSGQQFVEESVDMNLISVSQTPKPLKERTNRTNRSAVSMNETNLTSNLKEVTESQRTLYFKTVFGLGMTERLKQKIDELNAKRRQSVAENVFTPCASDSDNVSDSRKTLPSIAITSQLSEDLFNSKSNEVMEEDIEVEEESDSTDKTKSELKSESNSELNSESIESKSKTETSGSSDETSKPTETSVSSDETSKPTETSVSSDETSKPSECIITSDKSTSLDLEVSSALSVSIVESSDDNLVSSPTTIDATLNFTFQPSDDSDTFDPFVHTNHSFHTNRSFYETTSPLQLSFIVKDDTLNLLADELERQIEDIVIPTEDQCLMDSSEEFNDMFTPLRRLDAKQNGFTYEVLNEEKALLSYLWGTFALEVRFGSVVANDSSIPFTVRHINSINMKSLITAEEGLQMRQKGLVLKFNDKHKPLITIAHDLIISSFESERQQIVGKHKTSSSLDELVSDISVRVLSAKKLLTELRAISSFEICRLYPKRDDYYPLVVEILGLRKPFHVIIPINPKSYPDQVIHPTVRIPAEDKHLYCVKQFSAAFLRIESRRFDYIRRLIWGSKAFVRAMKTIIYEKQRNSEQRKAIQSARLVYS